VRFVPASGSMRAVAAEPMTAISPHFVPLRGSRGPRRVEMVLEFVRGHWRSGQQIVEHVKHESRYELGEQTAYNSSNGAARNAHMLAKSHGLAWWIMGVNREETAPAKPGSRGHHLYCVMRRNEPPPRHRAMDAGAEPIGDPPLILVTEKLLEQGQMALAERREAAVRGGLARGASDYPMAGQQPEDDKATAVGEGPARGTRRTQAAHCGSRPAPAQASLEMEL